MSSLQKVALDAIKIDRKIISEIAGNPDETTNASAIIKMGQSLNLRVIAEGVETTKDLEFLRTHRCDDAFGYYFGQPVPSGQFGEMSRAAKFLTARKSPEEATI